MNMYEEEQLLEIIWLFIALVPQRGIVSRNCELVGMSRQVCTGALDLEPMFAVTNESPIKVEETFFLGRREYNRSRNRVLYYLYLQLLLVF